MSRLSKSERKKLGEKIYDLDIFEAPVFNFVKPNSNDMVSNMNSIDLQEFLSLVNDFYLELRSKLNINPKYTFGFEIEYENCDYRFVKEQLLNSGVASSWVIKTDDSLKNGGEATSPIFTDTRLTWINLKKVCEIIGRSASIGKRAGSHIHIGVHALGDNLDNWINLKKIWAVYENIIFRFCYGEYLSERESLSEYAKPIAKEFLEKSNVYSARDFVIKYSDNKYHTLNFRHIFLDKLNKEEKNNTLEFRCPNGTLNPIIWQNNLNLFIHLIDYAKSSRYDSDIIEKRKIEVLGALNDLELYNEIFLDQALEFADMIFTKNVDKVYFLRQYLKSFELECDKYTKAKSFTK